MLVIATHLSYQHETTFDLGNVETFTTSLRIQASAVALSYTALKAPCPAEPILLSTPL